MALTRAPSDSLPRPLDGVERIAVLHAGGLGDTIFLSPALDAVRSAYSSAEIVLLGGALQAELLRDRPPVDRVIELPPIRGVTAPPEADVDGAAVDVAVMGLAAERFDIVIQAHGGGRYSNELTRRLGAERTLGCRTPDAAELDITMPHIDRASEVERWIELVSLIGAQPRTREPSLALLQGDHEEADRFLRMGGLGSGQVVAVHVGAGDARRRWPPSSFARVADELMALGCEVVFVGTEAERPAVSEALELLGSSVRERAIDACGALSLGGLAGLLARTDLFVGNDSGPLHLARAVGTRTVGIYWAPNVINAGPPGRLRHRPQVAWRLDCPECHSDLLDVDCGHRDSVVAGVPSEDVLAAAVELLADAATDAEGSAASPR